MASLLNQSKCPPLIYSAMGVVAIITSCLLTVYVVNSRAEAAEINGQANNGRDYNQIPFDTYDATNVCREEATDQLGASLVRILPDWHSTRFEADRQTYLVVLKADVGTLQNFEDAYVYCYIDPSDYAIKYFNAYDSKQKPLLSGFSFGDIIDSFGPSSYDSGRRH
ncbi:hypothetical protein HBA55_31545 [Pseudomaricurvus alkylphenolicus]|uniref:hypothetical protein n=1 Tax=Pseudomaricurvus alkylphenolicus TaxID=1306991 RepID=UPI0014227230|nr:hypothetical protein [Pseudomaricurvus alkylphenolicus]NIB44176.1 hypothetical protein [Pseudomaricurvus alkylphenolicus]